MPKSQNKNPDILIVDDSQADTMLMEEAIKNNAVVNQIHVLHDAAEAMNYLNKKGVHETATTPNLILLDLNMPGFTGKELLKILKSDPHFSYIPVTVYSGSSSAEDINESYSLGANCYIVKPADLDKFKKIISVINDFWLGIARLPV